MVIVIRYADRVELDHVEAFIAIVRRGGFTHAASTLHLSQPAISRRVHLLEGELGAPLFHRRPRIELTALGGAIRPYLQEIARHAHDARETARAFVPEVTVSRGPESFRAINGGMPHAVYTERT